MIKKLDEITIPERNSRSKKISLLIIVFYEN